jgi:carbonic anhydrase/acetyltransferase-like protein (isoleucine patch superfamily)
MAKIKIGWRTNIQDRAVIGTVAQLDSTFPSNVEIGDEVSKWPLACALFVCV